MRVKGLLAPGWHSGYYASSRATTISKHYLLTYKDGSRKHITREDRDSLLLAKQVKRTFSGNYLFIGKPLILHNLADLATLKDSLNLSPEQIRRFLAGLFIIEQPNGKQRLERLETPQGMHLRLEQSGVLPA